MSMTEKEKLQTELKILTLQREMTHHQYKQLISKYDERILELQNEIDNIEFYEEK